MWIHKRYSDVRGNLSLVVDGFRCKRCDAVDHIFLTGDYIDVHDNSNTDPCCSDCYSTGYKQGYYLEDICTIDLYCIMHQLSLNECLW